MRTEKFCRARLVERDDFSDDLAIFRFRPDAALPFVPGQYCTIGLYGRDDRPILRAYSIVSAPHEASLELFIELVHDGALTPLLWSLKTGDEVWIRRKVVGRFTRDPGARRHVMAATVTGAAPYLSMARAQRHALAEGTLREPDRFLVLHGASRHAEFGRYHDELRDFERDGWLTYVPTVSRPWADPGWTGEVGRVEDVLRKHMDAHDFGADAAGYACGHPQMIEHAHGIFRRRGLDAAHVHEEKYFTTPAAEAEAEPDAPSPTPAFAPVLRTVKAVKPDA